MIKSLMQGLTQKDMQAVVNQFNLKNWYYPTIMPLKENYTLDFKALETTIGLHVAADVVARGASIDLKTRPALQSVIGDIPKIAIKRTMDENELTKYDIALRMSEGDAKARELVRAWAEDSEYCFNGVAARLEYIALQGLSRGKVSFDADNNQGIVTEYNLDYKCPNKVGVSNPWSDQQKATPITDLRANIKALRKKGIYPKVAFMSIETFVVMAQTEEVIKQVAGFTRNALGISMVPSLEQVNGVLATFPDMYGVQIKVIDQDMLLEIDGIQKTVSPFVYGSVVLAENAVVGNTFWKAAIDDKVDSVATFARNGHTLVKKFAENEPLLEVTMGIAHAMPVWSTAKRAGMIDVTHDKWQIA